MNRKTRIKKLLLAFLFIFCVSACKHGELSRKRMIEIADEKAKAEGITSDYHHLVFDTGNGMWKEKRGAIDKFQRERIDAVVSGKNYQAILYKLKPNLLGGDLWIFVDKNTGEIITLYGEK